MSSLAQYNANNQFPQMLGLEQTLGSEIAQDTYLNELSLSLLTKNPEALFAEIHDEMALAFEEYIPCRNEGGKSHRDFQMVEIIDGGAEWRTVPANDTFMKVITSVILRTLFGLPLS